MVVDVLLVGCFGLIGDRLVAADRLQWPRPPRGTNRNFAAVASARRLSRDFISVLVRALGRRAARSKKDPLRRSNREVTQRLRKVSTLGRRIIAATAP